ncbi:MAG: hypothetical protein AABW66_03775 [Thermoproteota archaeon]
MKKITSFVLLILVSSMVLGGMTNTAQAQTDPIILLKIAKQAQKQLENQIKQNSSDKTKQLFKEGTQQIRALEESLKNNDIDSAKKYFLSAMKIFKEISQQLTNNQSSQEVATLKDTVKDPSADLLRMQDYVDNLKTIAKKYSTSINFSEIDDLFVTAKQQITDKQFDDALQTISKIKQITDDFNNKIRGNASQQEQSRAKEYAQKYLEQLDRLIEDVKNQGLSEDIIQKLVDARKNLSATTDPQEIIKQIKEIKSIKEHLKAHKK